MAKNKKSEKNKDWLLYLFIGFIIFILINNKKSDTTKSLNANSLTGEKGLTGSKGEPGERGLTGAKGDKGETVTISDFIKTITANYSVLGSDSFKRLLVKNALDLTFASDGLYDVVIRANPVKIYLGTVFQQDLEAGEYFIEVSNNTLTIT
jgi:hypothetical protein